MPSLLLCAAEIAVLGRIRPQSFRTLPNWQDRGLHCALDSYCMPGAVSAQQSKSLPVVTEHALQGIITQMFTLLPLCKPLQQLCNTD